MGAPASAVLANVVMLDLIEYLKKDWVMNFHC